jgi:hypothetical protein
MKAITLLFFLVMVQSHCEIHRPDVCDRLKEEIESSYKRNTPAATRMKMLLRYDELGCEEVAPFGKE